MGDAPRSEKTPAIGSGATNFTTLKIALRSHRLRRPDDL